MLPGRCSQKPARQTTTHLGQRLLANNQSDTIGFSFLQGITNLDLLQRLLLLRIRLLDRFAYALIAA
jgi:hypothetical protein